MASLINPNNIDKTYPVAGQDNDSQGFRDNFTNIQTNLAFAKAELEDLQNKAILKSALSGSALDNDFSGATVTAPKFVDPRNRRNAIGTVSGSITISAINGPYQTIITDGNISLSFVFAAPAGDHSSICVAITVTDTAHSVTLPAAVINGVKGIQNIQNNVVYFNETGTYEFHFSTSDAGSSITVNETTRGRNYFLRTPSSSVGSPGDVPGMIAVDDDYIYVCVAEYDGSTGIWKRTSAGSAW